ncbi:MAG: hypothetical protein CMM24_00060 [Rhodospirillaceae bacterium]|nr:hypothetical protein [Rhodospirillaceae bacterium]
MKKYTKCAGLCFFLIIGPLLAFAEVRTMGKAWWEASRQSSGVSPSSDEVKEAIIQVFSARAFSWRGIFGVHTWISVKPTNASEYTVYQLVGWRLRRGEDPVIIQRDIPDRLWYDAVPELLVDVRGGGVDELIKKIDKAAKTYPYKNTYSVWPGPNSNTFIAWIGRLVPELRIDLPPTAIGKDWLGKTKFFSTTPSATGYQFSVLGLFGILIGVEEGLEINVLGLNFGIDVLGMNLRLPGIGRLGFPRTIGPRKL